MVNHALHYTMSKPQNLTNTLSATHMVSPLVDHTFKQTVRHKFPTSEVKPRGHPHRQPYTLDHKGPPYLYAHCHAHGQPQSHIYMNSHTIKLTVPQPTKRLIVGYAKGRIQGHFIRKSMVTFLACIPTFGPRL